MKLPTELRFRLTVEFDSRTAEIFQSVMVAKQLPQPMAEVIARAILDQATVMDSIECESHSDRFRQKVTIVGHTAVTHQELEEDTPTSPRS